MRISRSTSLALLTTVMAASAVATSACAPTGTAQIFVEAEETIPEGLTPGNGEENIIDGWQVTYDKFLVTFANFTASSSNDATAKADLAANLVLDMKALPEGGLVVGNVENLPAIRFDKVGYSIPNASSDSQKAEGISDDDFDFMVQNQLSLYVKGSMTKDGQTVTFDWPLKAGVSVNDCASEEGDLGFAVPAGGTVAVKPTIHGDHWFFTNITQGAEITDRRAQWVADADADQDGETTLDELKNTDAADVFPANQYNLSGALIDVNTAFDYLQAQAMTLGDFQGEGECPTRAVQ